MKFNIDPWIITNLTLVAAGVFIFVKFLHWLRYTIPKSVQCWFCHYKTQVPFQNSNCWHCPRCEQYNGFSEDGDYNRVQLTHYEEKMNYPVTIQGRCKNAWKPNNQLCKTCNHNQTIKVQLLAEFVPLNEKNYDQEIEHYKTQLEKCYKPCRKCEVLLHTIFKSERENFAVPRKLNVNQKIKPGRTSIIINFVLSLCLTLISYFKTNKYVKTMWIKYLNYLNIYLLNNRWMKEISDTGFVTHLNILLTFGFFLSALGAQETESILMIINSLSWAINLCLNLFYKDDQIILLVQVVSGIFSCMISTQILLTVKTNSKKNKIEPKIKNTYEYASPATSTPSETPNHSYSQFEENIISPKKLKNDNLKKPEETLEPKIRGLNIGDDYVKNKNIQNIFSYQTSEDLSYGSSIWGNSSISKNSIHRRKNIISPTKFSTDPVRPMSNYGSFNSSLLDSTRRDVDNFSNPPDDCLSCSGHSQCRHFPSYPLPPYPVNYYYQPPPNYQFAQQPVQTNTYLWPSVFIFSTLTLVACNAGLIYSLSTKNFAPDVQTNL